MPGGAGCNKNRQIVNRTIKGDDEATHDQIQGAVVGARHIPKQHQHTRRPHETEQLHVNQSRYM